MTATDAQLRAQKKYDATHKDKFKNYHIKLNVKDDAEVIFRLDTVPNRTDYIRQLILDDINREYVKEVMEQKKALGIECPPITSIEIEGGK